MGRKRNPIAQIDRALVRRMTFGPIDDLGNVKRFLRRWDVKTQSWRTIP